MKWYKLDKYKQKEQWHYWFAWYPVTIKTFDDSTEKRVWLERVLRKGCYYCNYVDCGWDWKYKEVNVD